MFQKFSICTVFRKDTFSVTVFTEYVWTSGQTGEKILRFQIKADTCGPGLINPQLVYLLNFDLKRS